MIGNNEATVNLSSNITCCDRNVLKLLTQESISLMNNVMNELNKEDSALLIQIIELNKLHAALSYANSPIPPGIDADASLTAFRDCLVTGARSVSIGCDFSRESNSSFAFHHLTAGEA